MAKKKKKKWGEELEEERGFSLSCPESSSKSFFLPLGIFRLTFQTPYILRGNDIEKKIFMTSQALNCCCFPVSRLYLPFSLSLSIIFQTTSQKQTGILSPLDLLGGEFLAEPDKDQEEER